MSRTATRPPDHLVGNAALVVTAFGSALRAPRVTEATQGLEELAALLQRVRAAEVHASDDQAERWTSLQSAIATARQPVARILGAIDALAAIAKHRDQEVSHHA